MTLIHTRSLSETVDAVNEAAFYGHAISAPDRREVARWIAARQGAPGAFRQLAGLRRSPRQESGCSQVSESRRHPRVTSSGKNHVARCYCSRAMTRWRQPRSTGRWPGSSTAWKRRRRMRPGTTPACFVVASAGRRLAEHPRGRIRSARSAVATWAGEVAFDA